MTTTHMPEKVGGTPTTQLRNLKTEAVKRGIFNSTINFVIVLFIISCGVFKKTKSINNDNIIGHYENKTKVVHFKENLELLKDYKFTLTTQYEWNKYEYNGEWQLKADTLVLRCGSLDSEKTKYFKPLWLVKEKQKELILLGKQTYVLEKR